MKVKYIGKKELWTASPERMWIGGDEVIVDESVGLNLIEREDFKEIGTSKLSNNNKDIK